MSHWSKTCEFTLATAPWPSPEAAEAVVVPMQFISGQKGEGQVGDAAVPRVVVDEITGAQWVIGERDASRQPGARADRYLCFDSPDKRRRVWSYPSDWQRLSDADLLDLGEQSP